MFLQQFFKYYPEYITHDFWITGESYAGVYVPTLLMQIEANPQGLPPLTGIMVGDGCMGTNASGGCGVDSEYLFTNFMYGHSQMSDVLYNNIQSVCGITLKYGNTTSACNTLLNERDQALGGFNVYNIYDECYLENDELSSKLLTTSIFNSYNHRNKKN